MSTARKADGDLEKGADPADDSNRVRGVGLDAPRGVRRWVLLPIAVLSGIFFALPLIWIVVSAFRPERDIFRYLSPLDPRVLIPTDWSVASFTALTDGPFPRAVFNSLLVAGVTVVGGLIVCAMAAYALAAIDFPGRQVVFTVVVLGFLVPFDAIAIPLGELFLDWGLRNSYSALILPGIGNGLAVFALRQFFLAIPKELSDAAKVDGAGPMTILFRIYLPLARPALVGAGLLLFVFQWQAYLWPLIVISDANLQVGPVVLAQLQGQAEYGFDPGQIFAGTFILAVIPVVLLLRFQRHFVRSIAASGID
ncbi:carbohydrate ABC transporter permease [Euzebya tangerina]|uniref:carbohydrate ABC transporter permease n=1 Tax=Euzebya tangerina TaxID=591198 RepID=UPI000E31F602|nr:carbohydrate ABC transporter permease [Euzebya tangerina]